MGITKVPPKINQDAWMAPENLTDDARKKSRFRWYQSKKTGDIVFGDVGKFSKDEKKQITTNIETIYRSMCIQIENDAKSLPRQFDKAHLETLRTQIEVQTKRFKERHKGFCGWFYRIFVTPFWNHYHKKLLNFVAVNYPQKDPPFYCQWIKKY